MIKRAYASAAAASLLLGCTSAPLPMEQAELVAPVLYATSLDGTTLVVKRDAGGVYSLKGCRYELFLDGKSFATVRYGQAVQAHPPAGRHILSMKIAPVFPCDSGDVELAVDFPPSSKSIYRISTDPTGKATLQPTSF